VPLRRWQTFIDDVGLFLDSQVAARAIALDWEPHDLFGTDRGYGRCTVDPAGLLWVLDGSRLIALSQTTATIATRTGERQTYRCKPREPGQVLEWELSL
jgi:hypothetical protein